jgi:tRNA (cmo5U34)-methyltransferase
MWARYGRYLEGLKGPEYREKVFSYMDREDSPRSLPFQLELLRQIGFTAWDVLHRNSIFACYVGVK